MIGTFNGNRNRIECHHCGEVIEGRLKTYRFGSWDVEKQNFKHRGGSPIEQHYCAECWQQRYGRQASAYYQTDDPDELWEILAASNGRLVADMLHYYVGGRPFLRVVNGDLEACTSKPRKEGDVLRFVPERIDMPLDEFDRVVSNDDTDIARKILLTPVEETPFADLAERGDDSELLDGFSNVADNRGDSP